MRFGSAVSTLTDAWRAGEELGRSLRSVSPEVVLLFASISYEQDYADLHQGLVEGLGSPAVLVFGGTGDGVYERTRAANYGVSALAIDSGGAVRWTVSSRTGVGDDSFGAAQACAREAAAHDPSFAFVLADGSRADGARILDGLTGVLDVPFFGGLTGDDRHFTRSRIFVGGKDLSDGVAILAASGTVRFRLNAASGWTPAGSPGAVGGSEGNTVRRIGGTTAQAFIKEQTGRPLGETDLGIVPLAAYPAFDDRFFLRTPSGFDEDGGAVTLFGGIPDGTMVRVCSATREDVLSGVDQALAGILGDGFRPAAAVVVSCAGRKWLLEDRGQAELDRLLAGLGEGIPLAGFPSFGEIAPFRIAGGGYSPAWFHNVTFVVFCFGA